MGINFSSMVQNIKLPKLAPKPQSDDQQPVAKFEPQVPPTQQMLAAPSGMPKLDTSGIDAMRAKFFEGRRGEVNRSANQMVQDQSDAITRRMAAIGQGSGSGAAIGAQMKAAQIGEQQRAAGLNDVGAQEAGANAQAAEAQLGREFQSGLTDKDMAFKSGMFNIEQGNKLKELDLAERNFLLEKDAQEFNKQMAAMQAGQEPGGLLGSGGFLGTGIGGRRGLLGTGIGGEQGVFGTGLFSSTKGVFGQGGGALGLGNLGGGGK